MSVQNGVELTPTLNESIIFEGGGSQRGGNHEIASQGEPEANQDATSTAYYIMILCDSIATNDPMQLEKFVKKFKLRVIEDRKDFEAREVLEIF